MIVKRPRQTIPLTPTQHSTADGRPDSSHQRHTRSEQPIHSADVLGAGVIGQQRRCRKQTRPSCGANEVSAQQGAMRLLCALQTWRSGSSTDMEHSRPHTQAWHDTNARAMGVSTQTGKYSMVNRSTIFRAPMHRSTTGSTKIEYGMRTIPENPRMAPATY